MSSPFSYLLDSLCYPLTFSLWLGAVGGLAIVLGRRRSGTGIMAFALFWSLLWSVPQCSDWLRATLERHFPEVDETALPQADAVVVLGGGRLPRTRDPQDERLEGSRLHTGVRVWREGLAPVIVLSGGGGGRPGRSEAAMMARRVVELGVPMTALLLEEHSHSTRDNALYTAELAHARGIRDVLLVTSSLHMTRAVRWFRNAGFEVYPVPVSEQRERNSWRERWVPTRSALWRSGRAFKEYLALLAMGLEAALVPEGSLAQPGHRPVEPRENSAAKGSGQQVHAPVAVLAVGSAWLRSPCKRGQQGC